MKIRSLAAIPVATLLVLTGCSSPVGASDFPAHPRPDYQLGGPYPPAEGVNIVVRDRTAAPATGVYSVCYINAFQTQPGEKDSWEEDLLLRDDAGDPITDPDWPDEYLLDVSASAKRSRIAAVVGGWISDCASDGFDAAEFDNLDIATRSGGRITDEDAVALAAQLAGLAHAAGLAAGQKNYGEFAADLHDLGYDFAIAEECAQYDECASYTDAYGTSVIDIEYASEQDVSFARFCADPRRPSGVVLRDRPLAPAGATGHVAEWCP